MSSGRIQNISEMYSNDGYIQKNFLRSYFSKYMVTVQNLQEWQKFLKF